MATNTVRSGAMPNQLSFFPEPYPGELLYSMIARYSFQMGFKSARSAYEEISGRRLNRPVADLPFRLEEIASRLPRKLGLTAERLLLQHTLFPFYAAYDEDDMVAKARHSALGDEGKAALLLGTSAMPIGQLSHLRFCTSCLDASEKDNRDPHWLRAHQVPIAKMCTFHHIPLRLSKVELGIDSPTIDIPNVKNCPSDSLSLVPNGTDVDLLIQLSKDAACLLDGVYPPRAPRNIAPTLSTAFATKMSATGSRLPWSKLESALAPTLSGLAPAFPRIMHLGRKDRGWLDFALRGGRKTGVDAILLATLLLECMPDPEPPFGVGPWNCCNPLAEHYGARVIDKMEWRNLTHGDIRGRFTCKCGYVYTRRRLTNGTITDPYRMEFGPLFAEHVLSASTAGLSLTDAAKRAGTDSKTAAEMIRRENLPHRWDPERFDAK